jgi:hypothetical protein
VQAPEAFDINPIFYSGGEGYISQAMQARIMFIENKATGVACIGRASFSQTGTTIYYRGRKLQRSKQCIGGNHFDVESGEEYWISGPKKRGGDTLFGGSIKIDEDVRQEYWEEIRKRPARIKEHTIRCRGK